MKISALICEFNPLHNGHIYLIDKMRQSGATHIVGIMSGNFVQRGECAVMNKLRRSECAIKNGVDIIIELSVPYALSSAENFARGGVETAIAVNADELWFGSECNNIDLLKRIVEIQKDANVQKLTSEEMKKGITQVKALSNAISELYGTDFKETMLSPNNILGIEYLKALDNLKAEIKPKTIKRIAVEHDSGVSSGNFASASYLRNLCRENLDDCLRFMDSYTLEVLKNEIKSGYAPATLKNGERAIIAKLRTMTPKDFLQLPDVSEGLENRIYEAVQKFTSLDEITDHIKSKRYTHARIRRILMCAYLGITQQMQKQPIPYIRPLCFNENGATLLKKASEKLPIITSTAKSLTTLEGNALEFLKLEVKASELWGLFTPNIYPCLSDKLNFIRK